MTTAAAASAGVIALPVVSAGEAVCCLFKLFDAPAGATGSVRARCAGRVARVGRAVERFGGAERHTLPYPEDARHARRPDLPGLRDHLDHITNAGLASDADPPRSVS
ncbi:MAG: hypothetical protein AUJ79_11630 [Propionibacterium sp. CG1_02_60_36]|nr:MAG: hypothetical protein AUJ79_11630 [Propionibacterium sp. CG1_02_60_36]